MLRPENLLQTLVTLCVFGLVLALWLAIVMVWASRQASRARRLEDRLGLNEAPPERTRALRLWKDGKEATTLVVEHEHVSLWTQFDRKCRQAGWMMPAQSIAVMITGIAVLCCLLMIVLLQSVLTGLFVAAIIFLVFYLRLQQRAMKREAIFERQLTDAMDLAARSLRTGHPLTGALRLISEEVDDPVGTAFMEIYQRQALGASLEEAMQRVAAASGSSDLRLFATSVSIQLRSGGNLADMLDRLAAVIRQRIRLSRRVRVLTAQTQLSKRVLVGLPFFMFALLNILNPRYMAPLYQTHAGNMLLLVAATGLVAGIVIINRLAVLKY